MADNSSPNVTDLSFKTKRRRIIGLFFKADRKNEAFKLLGAYFFIPEES
jgi:hypothetical protein